MTSQFTSLTIVYSTVYWGADQRKHPSSVTLAFVRGIHRWPVNSPHKVPVMWKMFPFDDAIMCSSHSMLTTGGGLPTKLGKRQSVFKDRHYIFLAHMMSRDIKLGFRFYFPLQEFQWDRQLRGLILGAFSIGYVPFQIPFGAVANRFGPKWPLFGGMCFLTIGTFLSPVSARVSPYMLLVLQVLKGVACVSNLHLCQIPL